MSSHSSHHLREAQLVQFSLYVHRDSLKAYSFHFISFATVNYIYKSSVSQRTHTAGSTISSRPLRNCITLSVFWIVFNKKLSLSPMQFCISFVLWYFHHLRRRPCQPKFIIYRYAVRLGTSLKPVYIIIHIHTMCTREYPHTKTCMDMFTLLRTLCLAMWYSLSYLRI